MVIDVRQWSEADRARFAGATVYVDGREIHGVWFVDTDAGIVKSYYVLADAPDDTVRRFCEHFTRIWKREPSPARMRAEQFVGRRFPFELLPPNIEIEHEPDGPISRILRGAVRVELFAGASGRR